MIKTHFFKQHPIYIFSFALQTYQLLLSPFIFFTKATAETCEWLSETYKNKSSQKAGFSSVFSTTEPPVPETDSGLLASPYVCEMNILFIDHDRD